jgi:TfoX/Sxy family transcriptional regulator of competence genes
MPWEKSSSDLVDLFNQAVPAGPNIQVKKMFGYPCAFVNGNLFTGLFKQSMIFRLSPSDLAAFLDQPGTSLFEPMPGHKMKGYGVLRNPFDAGDEEVSNWMKCALQFGARLPAKKPRTTKKQKKKT